MSEFPYNAVDVSGVNGVGGYVVINKISTEKTKRGHICCKKCCDVRRAVIILNLINIAFIIGCILSLYGLKYIWNNPEEYSNETDDQSFQTTLDTIEKIPYHWIMFVSIIHIGISWIGIVGAFNYKVYMIGFAALMYIFDVVLSICQWKFLAAFIAALFAYPHLYLMQEIKHGIMSQESYKSNEEYSCCCV